MKMEIRVRCTCGSLFSFEDTPVNGLLEFPIACTNCGTDCTPKAHDFIRKKLLDPNSDPTEPAPRKGLLSLFKKSDPDELDHDFAKKKSRAAAEEEVSETGDETSVARLVSAGLAALLAGCLGALGWFYIAKATGYEIGYVAWALGGLAGWSSRLFAPRGHHLLGLVATVAALLAISGGQYLVSRWLIHDAVHDYVSEAGTAALTFAKDAAAAKADDDLRESVAEFKLVRALVGDQPADSVEAFRTYQVTDSGFAFLGIVQLENRRKLTFEERFRISDESNVKPAEIAAFKAKVLPALKQFANGKPDETSYEVALEKELFAGITFKSILANSIGIYTGLWLILGLGTAYRIARNAGLKY